MKSPPDLCGRSEIKSRRQIINLLKKHQIPYHLWGTGTWRTFDDLMRYHTRDRLSFRKTSGDGRLIVDVYPAVVVVIHRYKHQWLELYEDCQVFPNGQVLRRPDFNGIDLRDPVPSEKWCGLWASYHRHMFECLVQRELFKSPGYNVPDDDRLVHYRWRPRRQFELKLDPV